MTTSDSTHHLADGGRDMADAVILLGRGGTGASAREQLQALREALLARLPAACQVQIAFVDKAAPSLPEALDSCADARTVAVLPLFAPDEPALLRWLHKVVMRWRAQRGEASRQQGQQAARGPARIVFAPALLGAPDMVQLLLEQLRLALGQEDVAQWTGDNWQHDPQAWSQVPEHTHHALVCTGPRCTALGAVAVWQRLAADIKDHAALRERVRPLQTSCQYPCNHGPLVIVYPQGTWYGRLDPDSATEVVRQHVLDGQLGERDHERHHVHGPRLTGP